MAMWLLQKLRARGREYLWVLLPTTTEHLILVGTKFSILMPGKCQMFCNFGASCLPFCVLGPRNRGILLILTWSSDAYESTCLPTQELTTQCGVAHFQVLDIKLITQ